MVEQVLSSHVYLLGIFLGLIHSFEADHIAAMTTMASQTKSVRRSATLGAWWGLGHTASLLLVSFVILGMQITIGEGPAHILEGLVGVVLIILGYDAMRKVRKNVPHTHFHMHGETYVHTHPHTHPHGDPSRISFIVGCFHGLAGSSALILLALSATYTFKEGIRFVLSFGLGSILSMALFAACIGLIMEYVKEFTRLSWYVKVVVSIACIGIGISLAWTSLFSFL